LGRGFPQFREGREDFQEIPPQSSGVLRGSKTAAKEEDGSRKLLYFGSGKKKRGGSVKRPDKKGGAHPNQRR